MAQAEQGQRGADVEDDFVSPLTMIRGVLEMLRSDGDMPDAMRHRFLDLALEDCDRLGESVDRLIDANPAAIKRRPTAPAESISAIDVSDRFHALPDDQIVEVDMSDFAFTSSAIVNQVYDQFDDWLQRSGQQWYFMVNYRNCTIAPEAWVAFAHRGRKTNRLHSLGTVRYAVPVEAKQGMAEVDVDRTTDSNMFRSRQAAIDFLRKERKSVQWTPTLEQ